LDKLDYTAYNVYSTNVFAKETKMDIKQLLARRSDLSTFLIYLTREYPEGTPAKDNLKSILSNKVIEARNAYGSAVVRLNKLGADKAKNLNTQKVVCFTETPLEHVRLLVEEIQGRKFKFGPMALQLVSERPVCGELTRFGIWTLPPATIG
jgi:hypothetical protein